MTRRRGALLYAPPASAALLASVLSACGGGPCGRDPNKLQGSIGELYDIQVDSVKARKPDPNHLVLQFMHHNDIVTKVVADVHAFMKGVKIPLSSGDVVRVTSPETAFPRRIVMGTLQIDSELLDGKEVVACFDVLFDAAQDGTKRTLQGAIQTTLGGP